MPFDPEKHNMPAPVMHTDKEYPKWVTPHESHVVVRERASGDEVIETPGWERHHVHWDREAGKRGHVEVLVADADEEERALNPREDE